MAAGLEDFHLAEHSPYWLALRKLQPCSGVGPRSYKSIIQETIGIVGVGLWGYGGEIRGGQQALDRAGGLLEAQAQFKARGRFNGSFPRDGLSC